MEQERTDRKKLLADLSSPEAMAARMEVVANLRKAADDIERDVHNPGPNGPRIEAMLIVNRFEPEEDMGVEGKLLFSGWCCTMLMTLLRGMLNVLFDLSAYRQLAAIRLLTIVAKVQQALAVEQQEQWEQQDEELSKLN